MSGMSTALRAFLTRRLDPTTALSYALLFGLFVAVAITTAMIVGNQLGGR